MKKLIIASAVGLILSASVSANAASVSSDLIFKKHNRSESAARKEKREERKESRKLEGKGVSYQSNEQFYVDFGNVPVTGSQRSGIYDEFFFDNNGVATTAYYDLEANLIGTTSQKKFSDLPKYAQKHILSKYKDYKIERVVFFDDNEMNDTDMTLYNMSFDGEDNYFVELKNDSREIILHVDVQGNTSFFKEL